MVIFCGRACESTFDPSLGSLAFAVIDRAARDAALGDPTAGAWLLSETAQDWAELAGLSEGVLGELASKSLEVLKNGRS